MTTENKPFHNSVENVIQQAIRYDGLCRSLWDYMHIQYNEDAAYACAREITKTYRALALSIFNSTEVF